MSFPLVDSAARGMRRKDMVHTVKHTTCARFLDQQVALRSSYLLVYIIKEERKHSNDRKSTVEMIE